MERLPVEPTITDVMKACKFLRSRVRHTPAEYSFALSERAGAPVVLKLDNQQICGSFKVRAKWAYNKKDNLIEITEIPYTTTIEAIIDKIAVDSRLEQLQTTKI